MTPKTAPANIDNTVDNIFDINCTTSNLTMVFNDLEMV